jgi:hypothetical protein
MHHLWPRIVAYVLGVGFAGPVLTYQSVMMNVALFKWLGDRTKPRADTND